MSLHSGHDWEGKPHGEFALYIDRCREWANVAADERAATFFHSVRYVNEGRDRLFALRDCVVDEGEIRGQHFSMIWADCVFKKVDFSHTRGEAHWTRLTFEKINFHHLMANVSAAQTVFRGCNFNNMVLKQPVFLQCKFESCKINGALIGALFIDCEFEDVDLKNSRWDDPRTLEIRGTWKNAEQLWETSNAKAKAFFLRKPVEAVRENA